MANDPLENLPFGNTVLAPERVKPKLPRMYKVFLLNDDYTPMDFVVECILKFFNKTHEEATSIMLKVHQEGRAICGIYTQDIAETKVSLVMDYSRKEQHPLQCVTEPAE